MLLTTKDILERIKHIDALQERLEKTYPLLTFYVSYKDDIDSYAIDWAMVVYKKGIGNITCVGRYLLSYSLYLDMPHLIENIGKSISSSLGGVIMSYKNTEQVITTYNRGEEI